jgi:nitrite reductase/ring-hydroxylating ferredoxin subunit
MDFKKVARASDIKPGKSKGVWLDNESVLLANVAGRFFAIGNICTHAACNLSEGDVNGKNVVCACHGSIFDLTNGKVISGPAMKDEPTYEVKIEGDDILIKKR